MRRFRFSLRTLLLAISAICLVVLPIAIKLHRRRQQRAALSYIGELDGVTSREGGPDVITKVSFTRKRQLTDQDVAELVQKLRYLPKLNWVEIQSTRLSDRAIADLAELQSLEHLFLTGAPITDNSLSDLCRLSKLKDLDLQGARLSDESLTRLSALRHLESLRLSSPDISDSAITALAALPRLHQLDVAGTQVTEAGLKSFREAQGRGN